MIKNIPQFFQQNIYAAVILLPIQLQSSAIIKQRKKQWLYVEVLRHTWLPTL